MFSGSRAMTWESIRNELYIVPFWETACGTSKSDTESLLNALPKRAYNVCRMVHPARRHLSILPKLTNMLMENLKLCLLENQDDAMQDAWNALQDRQHRFQTAVRA